MNRVAILLVLSLALAGCTLPGAGTQYGAGTPPQQGEPVKALPAGGMMQGGSGGMGNGMMEHSNMPGMEGMMVKEVTIVASQFKFEPSTITVSKGDHVRLRVKSVDVKHGINIEGYDLKRDLNPGEEAVIDFVADKSGDFEFYCSVYCGEGHKEMEGKLIVR